MCISSIIYAYMRHIIDLIFSVINIESTLIKDVNHYGNSQKGHLILILKLKESL